MNIIFIFIMQFIFHCVLAVCGTYMIVKDHVGCGIFALILIYFTTYDYKSSNDKE